MADILHQDELEILAAISASGKTHANRVVDSSRKKNAEAHTASREN